MTPTGIQNIHAIGDRANKAVLDVFESISKDSSDKDVLVNRRPRIEHSQIMQTSDLDRAGKLGGKGSNCAAHSNETYVLLLLRSD